MMLLCFLDGGKKYSISKEHPFSTSCDVYWTDGVTDYCFYYESGDVGTRPVWARGDIFHPYCVDSRDNLKIVWNTRKYINAQVFSRDF